VEEKGPTNIQITLESIFGDLFFLEFLFRKINNTEIKDFSPSSIYHTLKHLRKFQKNWMKKFFHPLHLLP